MTGPGKSGGVGPWWNHPAQHEANMRTLIALQHGGFVPLRQLALQGG
jgi:hypothetical protein